MWSRSSTSHLNRYGRPRKLSQMTASAPAIAIAFELRHLRLLHCAAEHWQVLSVHDALLWRLYRAPTLRCRRCSVFLAVQVLTQVEYLAARREGSVVKHADGSWGTSGGDEPELPLSRPLKRARKDVSAAAGAAAPQAAQLRAQQGRRCAIM